MPFMMEDFDRQYFKKYFPRLTAAERQEVLQTVSPEERVTGLPAEERLASLPVEERLAGLSAEQIQQYLDRLSGEKPAAARKPRRKK